jgi:hypothetical protein
MAKAKAKPYPPALLELMASKTAILMKARTYADMGMAETAQPIWTAAASYEERIAPPLDSLGRNLEAAASRISAASCYEKGCDLTRAANLYQVALAAPLRPIRAATSRRCWPPAWTNGAARPRTTRRGETTEFRRERDCGH